jgi:hypothetical protein
MNAIKKFFHTNLPTKNFIIMFVLTTIIIGLLFKLPYVGTYLESFYRNPFGFIGGLGRKLLGIVSPATAAAK